MLRVISGSAKGHKLKTVKGITTRPTSDRVKESLFNIIAEYIPDADILDMYSGTGSLGIEALSRGAGSAVFIDKSIECINIIKENLTNTKLLEKALVLRGEVPEILGRLPAKSFDIVFIDPPYKLNLVDEPLNYIIFNDMVKRQGIIIVERSIADIIPEKIGIFILTRNCKYGDTVLSFYTTNVRLQTDIILTGGDAGR